MEELEPKLVLEAKMGNIQILINMRAVIKDNPLSFLTHAKYKILYKYEDPKMKS